MKHIMTVLRKIVACCAILVFARAGYAANVQWNFVEVKVGPEYNEMNFKGGGFLLNVWYSYEYSLIDKSWSITPRGSNTWFIGTVLEAFACDVVDASTYTGSPVVFARATDSGPEGVWTAVTGKGAADAYLAVLLDNDMRGIHAYGWIKFTVTDGGELNLVSSAIDLDGGPMLVGGGSAVPESSSGCLALLGCALLMLRRRTRRPMDAEGRVNQK